MFQLTAFRLTNYRCFEDTDWIGLNRFSVFIGKNDGGKSSALHALKVVLACQQFEDADHRQVGVEEEAGTILRANELAAYLRINVEGAEVLLRGYRVLGSATVFEIETELVQETRLNQDLASLSLPALKELCQQLSLDAEGNQARKETFLQCLTKVRESLPKHKGWAALPAGLRNAFPVCLSYDETTSLDPEGAVRTFASNFFKTELQEGIRASTRELREQTQTKLNLKAEEVARILQSECDEIVGVEIPIADDAFSDLKVNRVRITKRDGTEVDWTRIGRGKKREMSLAVFRWQNSLLTEHLESAEQAQKAVIVLFDEPDINLDYQSQCKVTESLEAMSRHERCQAIVATHSHNLIDSVPIDSLIFFGPDVPDPIRRIWTYSAASDDLEFEKVFLRSLGISNATFFNERMFVCCSGETEIGALPLLFRHTTGRSMSMSGVLLINGFNDSGAVDAAKILRKNGRKYVLLMDSDMLTDSKCGQVNIKQKSGLDLAYVRYLGSKEFEDLFDDDVWCATLNELPQVDSDADSKTWANEEVASFRNSAKFSEAIRSAAEAYSLEGRSKPKLGVRVARKAIELERIPELLTETIELIHSHSLS